MYLHQNLHMISNTITTLQTAQRKLQKPCNIMQLIIVNESIN